MILYKTKPIDAKNLSFEELERIADGYCHPFIKSPYKYLIDITQFVQLSCNDIRYWFPIVSNEKYFKKCDGIRESYRNDNDDVYRYINQKWYKAGSRFPLNNLLVTKKFDQYRTALIAMERLYHFMVINQLNIESDIKQYIKTSFFNDFFVNVKFSP